MTKSCIESTESAWTPVTISLLLLSLTKEDQLMVATTLDGSMPLEMTGFSAMMNSAPKLRVTMFSLSEVVVTGTLPTSTSTERLKP